MTCFHYYVLIRQSGYKERLLKAFLSVVLKSIDEWESKKFKEGLDKVKLLLYRTYICIRQ